MSLRPEFQQFVQQEQEIEHICGSAIELWREQFDRDEFLTKLGRFKVLAALDTKTTAEEDEFKVIQSYFKKTRKAAMFLKTSYLFFDVGHEAPEQLQSFTWQLGQLKDRFQLGRLALPFAEMLEQLLSTHKNWGNFNLHPDNAQEAVQQADDTLKKIRKLLAKGTLAADEFHRLRKHLRLFANVYTLATRYTHDERVSIMHAELIEINELLGVVNDRMVDASLTGGLPYEENQLTLAPDVSTKIKNLLNGN